jgi:hypothetical protein
MNRLRKRSAKRHRAEKKAEPLRINVNIEQRTMISFSVSTFRSNNGF